MPAGTDESVGTIAPRGLRGLRALVAIALACGVGIFAFTGAMGLTGSGLLSAPIALGIAGLVGLIVWRRPIVPLEAGACSRALKIVSGLATIAALVQLARLSVFILDPSQVNCALGPSRGLGLTSNHSCLSAYFVAARVAGDVPNIYADSLYSLPDDTPRAPRKPRKLGTFNIDLYEYPPPFLLLPRLLTVLAPDFVRYRMLWFALDGAIILIALLAVARFIGPVAGTRALLLSPLVWAADPTIGTLQIGNVQPMAIAAAMLAMVLFERRRHAAGGALLAYITVSKLFPGLLLVYLLVRRDWRAVAWTSGLAGVLIAISLLDTGWAPYAAFLHHLPGLVGGEAFAAFRNPAAIAINQSVPGMVFKLGLFGVPGLSFGAAKIVGWIYTLIVVAATVMVARRTVHREEQALAWLAILIFATLRSPFLPGYAVFPPLWLLTLLAATAAPTARTIGLTLLLWIPLNALASQATGMDPRLISTITLLPQMVTVGLALFALRRRQDAPASAAPSPPLALAFAAPAGELP